jgi:hypothetical protein
MKRSVDEHLSSPIQKAFDRDTKLIKSIQDALGTAETGEALVEVARNAHRAEQELAAIRKREQEQGEPRAEP